MTLFSGVFGVLMIAAAAWPAGAVGLVLLAAAAAAVVAGLFLRQGCVLAVLLTVAGTALGHPAPLLAAVSGLAATGYLLTRYAADALTLTTPTAIGMLGFTVAGAAAATLPLQLTWVPLVAPAIMVVILIVTALPLVGEPVARPADEQEPAG